MPDWLIDLLRFVWALWILRTFWQSARRGRPDASARRAALSHAILGTALLAYIGAAVAALVWCGILWLEPGPVSTRLVAFTAGVMACLGLGLLGLRRLTLWTATWAPPSISS